MTMMMEMLTLNDEMMMDGDVCMKDNEDANDDDGEKNTRLNGIRKKVKEE